MCRRQKQCGREHSPIMAEETESVGGWDGRQDSATAEWRNRDEFWRRQRRKDLPALGDELGGIGGDGTGEANSSI